MHLASRTGDVAYMGALLAGLLDDAAPTRSDDRVQTETFEAWLAIATEDPVLLAACFYLTIVSLVAVAGRQLPALLGIW